MKDSVRLLDSKRIPKGFWKESGDSGRILKGPKGFCKDSARLLGYLKGFWRFWQDSGTILEAFRRESGRILIRFWEVLRFLVGFQ